MAIDGVLIFGVALALPVWLVVEELVHRELSRMTENEPKAARPTSRVPASEAA